MVQTARVTFEACAEPLVGILFLPDRPGPAPGLVLDGPLTSVKEQVASNYGRALAERGFVALAFDHRFFGESGGQPRQYEAPPKKIEDLRAAVAFLATRSEVLPDRIGMVGVCAGAGYTAGAVAHEPRVRAYAAVAGFFHDAAQQRSWMGDGYESAIREGVLAREAYERTGQVQTIPAVGKGPGPVAMPMADAFEYYGTARGALPNYTNAFAVMSREFTVPYDAQSAATQIEVPTLLVHSDNALAPALARKFFEALRGPKELSWLTSKAQTDFYDDPALVQAASDRIATHLHRHLGAS